MTALRKKSLYPENVYYRPYQGKPLYSHAVVVESGRLAFISGQVARDAEGKVVGDGDMRAQIEQVAKTIEECLKAVGATVKDIVKMVTYVTDIDEYSKHVDLRAKYFAAAEAASSTVEVSRRAG